MGDVTKDTNASKDEASEIISAEEELPGTVSSDAQNSLNIAVRYLSFLNPLTIHKQGKTSKAYLLWQLFASSGEQPGWPRRLQYSMFLMHCKLPVYDNFLEVLVM